MSGDGGSCVDRTRIERRGQNEPQEALMLGPILLAILVANGAATQASGTVPPAPATQQPAETPWPPEGVYRVGNGVTLPRVITDAKPSYTADAMRAKVHGVVVVEAVVLTDGTVGEIRVKRSLDRRFGLDDEVVATVKKWRFAPGTGTKDGVAVPVLVEIEMSFQVGK
jgi:periplasmic protein TonB